MLGKLSRYLTKVSVFLTAAALIAGMVGCDGYTPPSQNLEIRDWYDLDAVRNNVEGNHILMNDLDSTAPGYEELASPTANGGKGWQPIGFHTPHGATVFGGFAGTFDGQGYEIRDLFINHPDEDGVGLFVITERGAVIRDMGLANVTVVGKDTVGGLAGGIFEGTVIKCYSSGSVTGNDRVGGLTGYGNGIIVDSYFTGSVTGYDSVGGLVGIAFDLGTVSNSHFTGNVTGTWSVGGLVGENWGGTVSDSYSSGSVTGGNFTGGLVGVNYYGSVTHSYSTGRVNGESDVGGLVGYNKGTVSNSFWNMETSGQATSDGGTGKTTAEMKDIDTFSGVGWNIIAVGGPGMRNPAYIWNIVDDQTYPFLSWQP